MDENTAPDNFLTHSFNLKPGTDTWNFLQKQFEDAYRMKDTLTHMPTHAKPPQKPMRLFRLPIR